MTRPRHGHHLTSDAEDRILAAVYTAPRPPSLSGVCKMAEATERTVRRTVVRFPHWVTRQGGLFRHTVLTLTVDGRRAAEELAGRG